MEIVLLILVLLAGALIWLGLGRRRVLVLILGLMALRLVFASDLINLRPSVLHHRLSVFAPLGFVFLTGALVWHLRDHVPLRADLAIALVLGTGTIAMADPSLKTSYLLLGPALGYAALVYGYAPGLAKLPGDVFYGIYIYGWPVGQALVWIWGPFLETHLAIWNMIAVIPFALLSWVLIEKPALRWGRSIVRTA